MTGVAVGAGVGVAVGTEVGTGVAVTVAVGVGVGVAGVYAIASHSPLPLSVYVFPVTMPVVSMLVKVPSVTTGAVQARLPVPLGDGAGDGVTVETVGVGAGDDEARGDGVTLPVGAGVTLPVGDGAAVAGVDETRVTGPVGRSTTVPLLQPAANATTPSSKKVRACNVTVVTSPFVALEAAYGETRGETFTRRPRDRRVVVTVWLVIRVATFLRYAARRFRRTTCRPGS
jgi:hypothetical protein